MFFATQTPSDIPASILAQLGSRFEHALRAFTPQDADNLKKTVRTFPITTFYDVEQTIQQLGIGEALVTVLSPNGVPTPLAATMLVPPDSLMAALDPATFQQRVATGTLSGKYAATIDRQSAHEIITARVQQAQAAAQAAAQAQAGQAGAPLPGGSSPARTTGMTPAQMDREIARQAREQAKEMARAQRQADIERRRQAREAATAARQRDRMVETGVRTAGRVITSRAGQDAIRGVFGVLFGKR